MVNGRWFGGHSIINHQPLTINHFFSLSSVGSSQRVSYTGGALHGMSVLCFFLSTDEFYR
jgi:hypothetical protein